MVWICRPLVCKVHPATDMQLPDLLALAYVTQAAAPTAYLEQLCQQLLHTGFTHRYMQPCS